MILLFRSAANAVKRVVRLSNEMFADKGAEERKRQKQEALTRGITEVIIRRDEQLMRRLSEIIGEESEEEEEEEEAVQQKD